MHKYLVFLFIAFALLMCNQSPEEESSSSSMAMKLSSDEFKRYGFKSGIIEYEFSGEMQSGTEKLYFDNWGMIEAKYLDIEVGIMGLTQKQKTMTLLKGDSTWSYDYATGRLTRIKTPMWEGMKKQAQNGDLEEVGMNFIKQMGGEKVGSETVAGKNCDIWDIPNMLSKTWLWEGLPLKTVAGAQGMQITQTATSVQVDVTVPKDKFEIPDEVEPQEAMDLQNLEKLMEKIKAPKE